MVQLVAGSYFLQLLVLDLPRCRMANQCINRLTFDVIGDLAFGEPFGAVAAGT